MKKTFYDIVVQINERVVTMNFKDLKLSEAIVKALEDKGYETPTTIQMEAIPQLLDKKDVLAKSQTGSGKTAAFGLPVLDMIDSNSKKTQALILCPTRELSLQVKDELESFAKYKDGINIVCVYGGEPIDRQLKQLKKGAQIIVATPGRLMDHLRRKSIKLNDCHYVVLDEADEMLNMGFIEDIETIFEYLPEQKQIALFSATMPKAIQALSEKFLTEPEIINVSTKLTVSKIRQMYYVVPNPKKEILTLQLLQLYNSKSTMIFCNTKKRVDELTAYLNKAGYPSLGLHGDMKQEMRTMVMDRFKRGQVSVLIATDVAARGIDVENMDMVLNYDVPQELEYYVHRIGRTGRAGNEGLAITLVAKNQLNAIRQIERKTKVKIEEMPLPTKEDLNTLMVEKLIRDINKWSKEAPNPKLFDIAYNGLRKEKISQEDIIVAFINEHINDYALEAVEAPRSRSKSRESIGATSTIVVSMGRKDGVTPAHLVSGISNSSGLSSDVIGKIDIQGRQSYVDVSQKHVRTIMAALKKTKIKGKKVTVTQARNKRSK